ncbi:hypothetical protein L195_g048356 [Trifolium pratense]|uniref:Uncharacterized protein n=1 Tax=Trifolium pratense TaxID=57577 RepID=A0A2K3JL17_TRIPR|nr:hypothetical protein L195_g048356 [Trifolium pratense]
MCELCLLTVGLVRECVTEVLIAAVRGAADRLQEVINATLRRPSRHNVTVFGLGIWIRDV